MASARHSFKEQHVLFASALLLTLSIIAGLLVVERSENNRFLENQRQSVVEKASTIRARLEGLLNADLLLLGFRLCRHLCDYFSDPHVVKTSCYPMKPSVFAQKL